MIFCNLVKMEFPTSCRTFILAIIVACFGNLLYLLSDQTNKRPISNLILGILLFVLLSLRCLLVGGNCINDNVPVVQLVSNSRISLLIHIRFKKKNSHNTTTITTKIQFHSLQRQKYNQKYNPIWMNSIVTVVAFALQLIIINIHSLTHSLSHLVCRQKQTMCKL